MSWILREPDPRLPDMHQGDPIQVFGMRVEDSSSITKCAVTIWTSH